ncbi:MAG TPA: adenylate/guanylate cyclase domain-containing protein [Mycobacteriales bacterium]|nr:adenylate/guanylate cyclase domain-containing protein [Mycobacteriales bacterium]
MTIRGFVRARVARVRSRWFTGRAVLIRTTVNLILSMVSANVLGAFAVCLLAIYVIPEPTIDNRHQVIVEDLWLAGIYVLVAVTVGVLAGIEKLSSLASWLPSERQPTPEQQLVVLRGPRTIARGVGLGWTGATILFGGIAMTHSVDAGLRIATIIGLSGLITASVAYRMAELILREAAGRALSASPHPQLIAQSVAARSMLTWVLGTGVPALGVVLLGIASLIDRHVGSRSDLAFAMAVLGGNCLVAGAVTTFFASRATADPIVSVRNALGQIERGNYDVTIPVYDGTDLGLLQAGFNRMAAGLRERERLRELFGVHVGEEVARQALERGVQLGGEQREVAVLFIDLVGSTRMASRLTPAAVVDLLNRYFAIVVSVVEAHGGLVNKFAGDAALAIFGAPVDLDDREARALVAARTVAQRVTAELPECDFGVGVTAGITVAGNVGAASRLEYTVIGDPVNEAARLAEIAKTLPGRVLASGDVIEAATGESAHWAIADEVRLRGRSSATSIYIPIPEGASQVGARR